jgi:hypothetical protein
MAYRNNNPVFMYPKDPKKRMWLTNYAGIVDADWKEKCCTPIIFLDIDGVLNSGDWAEELYKNPNPNYHNFCDPKAVDMLIEFLQSTGFMLVLSSSWRRSGNIYETFKSLDSIPYLNKISPYIIGQTCRLNLGRTNGKRWCRGDEIKVWVDEFKPSYYMIVDDDTDMLIEQFPRLIQTDPEHGLTYDDLIKLKCHFSKIQYKKGWKEKFDFSFGDRILMYNYTTKKYE